ncbi:MAG: TatD family hydrolase [Deltaproteobacteria bacterium]|jgi:TatD DNase family protein|nr:TatD family hydrolase [Deltaproteobacteria bacterium]
MDITDSHCHLFLEDFETDRAAVLSRAKAAGVSRIVNVGLNNWTNEQVLAAARECPALPPAVGWHPHYVDEIVDGDLEKLLKLAQDPQTVAFGEIGLDYHYGLESAEKQRKTLEDLLLIAVETKLPVIIHCRDAWTDLVKILAPVRNRLKNALLHCFSGGPKEVEEAAEMDLFFSFSGVVTFPKATLTHEALTKAPLNRLMTETDAPYLAPVPRRGRRNEPALLVHHLKSIGDLLHMSPEAAAALTTRNAVEFFNLSGPTLQELAI